MPTNRPNRPRTPASSQGSRTRPSGATRSTRATGAARNRSQSAADTSRTRASQRSQARTRATASSSRSRAERGDYRYQNLLQPPYGPAIGQESLWERFRRPVLAVAAVAVLALVVFLVANAAGSCSGTAAPGQARFTVTKEQDITYALNPGDLLSIPESSEVTAVSLAGTDASFSVSPASLGQVNAAIAQIEQLGPCGFVFMDISTGRALAYNAGEVLYCASATKAPLVYYALTHPEGDGLWDEDYENIDNAITWSDNDSYFRVCATYFDDPYMAWLASYGVEHEAGRSDYFPTMSARSFAAIWAEIYQWLQAGSDDAQWLGGLLGATDESYIRDGLAGTGATVQEKAGWMGDDDARSITDAGIVRANGRDYLLVIITEQPEWESAARANASQLARALFDLRGLLAPHVLIEV